MGGKGWKFSHIKVVQRQSLIEIGRMWSKITSVYKTIWPPTIYTPTFQYFSQIYICHISSVTLCNSAAACRFKRNFEEEKRNWRTILLLELLFPDTSLGIDWWWENISLGLCFQEIFQALGNLLVVRNLKTILKSQYFPPLCSVRIHCCLVSTEYHKLFWVTLKAYSTRKWNWILLLSSWVFSVDQSNMFSKKALGNKVWKKGKDGNKLKVAPKQVNFNWKHIWGELQSDNTRHKYSGQPYCFHINRLPSMAIKWY